MFDFYPGFLCALQKFNSNLLRVFFLILIIFIVPSISASAEKIFSPVSIASGNALFLPLNPEENSLTMGSSLGLLNNFGFYGGYNLLPGENEFWGSVFIPDSVGVFGISYSHRLNLISNQYSGGLFQLGFGKNLTKNLQFGFLLGFSYTNPNDLKSSIGIEPSIVYRETIRHKPHNVEWFNDIFLYSVLRNLDVPLQDDLNRQQSSFHFGLGSTFLKSGDFQSIFQVESSMNANLNEIPITFIWNFQYKIFQLRGAYIHYFPVNSQSSGENDFSVGAGLQVPVGGLTIMAQYGLTGLLSGDLEHYFAAGSVFNTIDQTAPILKVSPQYTDFSPNGDDSKDEIIFYIHAREKSPIQDWRMDIKNANGEIVRSFKKDLRERSIYFPVYRILTDLFKRKEYQNIPQKIIWDGTSNRIDSIVDTVNNPKNIDVPDGNYFYEMTITDSHGLKNPPERGTIVLDRKGPVINLKRDLAGESSQAEIVLSLYQIVQAENEDQFIGMIINNAGKSVKTFQWNSLKELPGRLVWNGKNDRGVLVSDGTYSYKLIAYDKAGNQKSSILHDIHVITVDPEVLIVSESGGFSPNGDKSFDQLKFFPSTELKHFEQWSVIITRTLVRNFKNINPVISWHGQYGNFPTNLVWDGKDLTGKNSPDGVYYLTLLIFDKSGKIHKSLSEKIVVDTSPPEVSIMPDKSIFSPDGDGIDDEICIYSKVQDRSSIKSYVLMLYEVLVIDGKISRIPFKKWAGESTVPGKLNFYGISDFGLDMESFHTYELDVSISDIYDNTVQKKAGKFFTDVLVNNEGKFLKITLNGLSFSNNDQIQSFDKLSRVLSLLIYDYPEYRIRVEGHTGSPGDEETNLKKSEIRARSVMAYFVAMGLPKYRIGYQGYGEVIPLTEIPNELSSYKNNRIELILIK